MALTKALPSAAPKHKGLDVDELAEISGGFIIIGIESLLPQLFDIFKKYLPEFKY